MTKDISYGYSNVDDSILKNYFSVLDFDFVLSDDELSYERWFSIKFTDLVKRILKENELPFYESTPISDMTLIGVYISDIKAKLREDKIDDILK